LYFIEKIFALYLSCITVFGLDVIWSCYSERHLWGMLSHLTSILSGHIKKEVNTVLMKKKT